MYQNPCVSITCIRFIGYDLSISWAIEPYGVAPLISSYFINFDAKLRKKTEKPNKRMLFLDF